MDSKGKVRIIGIFLIIMGIINFLVSYFVHLHAGTRLDSEFIFLGIAVIAGIIVIILPFQENKEQIEIVKKNKISTRNIAALVGTFALFGMLLNFDEPKVLPACNDMTILGNVISTYIDKNLAHLPEEKRKQAKVGLLNSAVVNYDEKEQKMTCKTSIKVSYNPSNSKDSGKGQILYAGNIMYTVQSVNSGSPKITILNEK